MKAQCPFSDTIWNEIEALADEELFGRVTAALLRRQLSFVLERSPFYQRKFKGVRKVPRERVLALHDTLPFTEKSELLVDQDLNRPYGSNVCAAATELSRIQKTSGTTGLPLWLALTAKDVAHTYECGARCFYACGLRPGHVAINCMNYCMWAGGYTDHGSLETVGAAVIPFGVGNSKMLIETLLRLRPQVLHSTPSYLVRLKEILHNEFSLTPRDLSLQLGLFGGEGGLQDQNFRTAIEQEWGFRAMNANYGMSDVLSMFGAECEARQGLHFMGQGVIHPTLIDPVSEENIPIETGRRGELVLTNLVKQAQPVIRFRTRDMLEIVGTGLCTCGRRSFRFAVLGRSDDMIVVKGINLFPSAVASVINRRLAVLTGEYAVLASKSDPIDRIVVKAETRRDTEAAPALAHTLQADLWGTLFVRVEVELVEEGALPKSEGKTARLQRIL